MENGRIQEKRANKIEATDKSNMYILLLSVAAVIIFIFSLGLGQFEISFIDTIKIVLSPFFPIEQTWDATMSKIVLEIRLPRLIACVLVGGGLGLSGAIYQGIFRNPLVSQDMLGVSNGAAVMAALAITLGYTDYAVQVAAFIGGIIAILLVLGITALIRNSSSLVLILAGIIVSGFASSLLTLIKYLADAEVTLANITYWLMGSLSNVVFPDLRTVYLPMILCIIVLLCIRWYINILSLGDNEAMSLGVNAKGIRMLCIITTTILIASAVCISGTISWFGLVIPHLSRLVVGDNHTKLVPMSFVMGVVIMMLVDNVARTLSVTEIPLSVITGIVGVPIFTLLLIKQRVDKNDFRS
ncbi:iron ABC transporter permease [Alkalibaculum bacchi]|uniref:FecCD family ABC transporter permease n=1 Tax=Alkalibaculum bacchi TaxID=645887 RepID=UPI0026EBC987|nr:iron ABC transporter permease [Alkalibaculum bacchi]